MDTVNIEYRIKIDERKTESIKFELDGKSFDLIAKKIADPPKWTTLSYKQCPHCPLNPEEHPHCPVALQIYDVVERFDGTQSIDIIELEVITEDRRVFQTLDIQRALASMLDLVFPVCGCPKTAYMKPLARFHLPLASEEETVFRVTGMYLLSQYFVSQAQSGGRVSFDGLSGLYQDMHILNTAVAKRLVSVTQSDSLKNAITLVDMYSTLVPLLLEDRLVEMREFFQAYLPEQVLQEAEPKKNNYLEQAKSFSLELVPLELGGDDGDDTPDRLKKDDDAVNKPAEKETKKAEAAVDEKEATINKILGGLSLELEPLDIKNDEPPANG